MTTTSERCWEMMTSTWAAPFRTHALVTTVEVTSCLQVVTWAVVVWLEQVRAPVSRIHAEERSRRCT